MSKVLVTGSEGSLMQAVIPKLIDNGHYVIGVDNLYRHGVRKGVDLDYHFRNVDCMDTHTLETLFKSTKPDYVIQAAAKIYGVGGFNAYCAEILGDDITVHANVLRASVDSDVKRVVYISSSMVYETCIQSVDLPVSESMPERFEAPKTDYGLSKFVGERLSKAYQKQYGLDYTIWRPFNIITPFEQLEPYDDQGICHVFADFINEIVVKGRNPMDIIGNGDQVRCFTWIGDVAQAIADYSFYEVSTKNETFNLGNLEPITMIELANKINTIAHELRLVPKQELEFFSHHAYDNDVKVRVPSVSKTKRVLGWEATVKTDDSIRRCLEYLKNGYSI